MNLGQYSKHISGTYKERINAIIKSLDTKKIHQSFILFNLQYTLDSDENAYTPSIEQIEEIIRHGLEKMIYFSSDLRYRGFVYQCGHFSFFYENKNGEEYFNVAFIPKNSIYSIRDDGTEGFERIDRIVNISE